MNESKQELGSHGEQFTCDYLHRAGYIIREKNYTCRYGEIDLIAEKEEVLAFIEVKLRNTKYFFMSDLITPSKQRKIITTAKHYLRKNTAISRNYVYRFDVAFLIPDAGQLQITYIKNAFTQPNR